MRASQSGFNLIEVLVTLTVLGVLIALGAPSLAEFLQNQQIRAAAEAMVNGLQVARGEAIRRNLAVQVAIEPASSGWSSGWTVCEATVAPCDSSTLTTDATLVIQSRSPEESTANARFELTPGGTVAVTFSPLGSVRTLNLDETPPLRQIDVFNTDVSRCSAQGGPLRCLRVVVSAGGSIRMCDPTPGIVFPDPRACP